MRLTTKPLYKCVPHNSPYHSLVKERKELLTLISINAPYGNSPELRLYKNRLNFVSRLLNIYAINIFVLPK